MNPVYDQDNVTIYHGDNRTVLASLVLSGVKADLVCTDPPYNVSHLNGEKGITADRLPKQPKALGRRKRVFVQGQIDLGGSHHDEVSVTGTTGRSIIKAFGEWDYEWNASEFLFLADDILRDGGQLIAFTSEFLIPAWLKTPLKHRALLFWNKTNPTPALPGTYIRPIEIAVWQTKGSNWTFIGDGYTSPIYTVPSISGGSVRDLVEPRVHPTQKPQELWRRLLKNHAKPGDLIIDPFMGSGSCVRAAYDLGMRVIGIDNGQDENGVPWTEHAIKLMRQVRLPL